MFSIYAIARTGTNRFSHHALWVLNLQNDFMARSDVSRDVKRAQSCKSVIEPSNRALNV